MNQTNPKLIFMIVAFIGSMALMGVTSLCASLFIHVYADPSIMTAVLTITSGLVGTLGALLTKIGGTASQPEGTITQISSVSSATPVAPILPTGPIPVEVKNTPAAPVPTKDTTL